MKNKSILLLFLVSLAFLGNFFIINLKANEKVTKVIMVDDSSVINRGIFSIGVQKLYALDLKTGEVIKTTNFLNGDKSLDDYYKVGDKIIVGTMNKDGKTIGRALAYYRLPYLKILFLIFAISLLLYSKTLGIKSLFSFFASVYLISKFMVPLILKGRSPFQMVILTIIFLTGIIIFSMGINKKTFSAFSGTVFGLLISICLTSVFSNFLNLKGFTMPMSGSLLASGNFNLDFKDIFYSSIILSASGAAMDIAMDISASLKELLNINPNLNSKDLLKASFNIGNSVVGTMSTTLLLAYTGGNLTMMMFFLDREMSIYAIINSKIITAEILRTLIGTISLIIVAPVTALISIFIYKFEYKLNFNFFYLKLFYKRFLNKLM